MWSRKRAVSYTHLDVYKRQVEPTQAAFITRVDLEIVESRPITCFRQTYVIQIFREIILLLYKAYKL